MYVRAHSLGITTLCVLALLLTACSSAGTELSREEQRELAAKASESASDFLTYLEGRSILVQSAQPHLDTRQFSSSAQRVYQVSLEAYPGLLYIYEYADEATARADGNRLDFGSLQTVRRGVANFRGGYQPMVTTQDAPVYQRGSIIVAYLGRDVAVRNALHNALGNPIR